MRSSSSAYVQKASTFFAKVDLARIWFPPSRLSSQGFNSLRIRFGQSGVRAIRPLMNLTGVGFSGVLFPSGASLPSVN